MTTASEGQGQRDNAIIQTINNDKTKSFSKENIYWISFKEFPLISNSAGISLSWQWNIRSLVRENRYQNLQKWNIVGLHSCILHIPHAATQFATTAQRRPLNQSRQNRQGNLSRRDNKGKKGYHDTEKIWKEMYRFWRKSFKRTPCSWVAQLHPLHSSCCLTIYNNGAKKAIESRPKSKKSTRKPLEKRQQGEERKPRYWQHSEGSGEKCIGKNHDT